MGLIKETLEIDFYIDPRPMTKEDERVISDYIKSDKLKRKKKAERRSKSTDTVLAKATRKNKVSA